jgi:hypothetical protein
MTKEEIDKLREDTRSLLENKFGNIVFEEIPHRYTIDGVEYTPVSNIISQYENPFDEDRISKGYAERNGLSQKEVLKTWKWTNRCATIMGTRSHEFGESYTNLMCGHKELICEQNKAQYVSEENWLVPTFPQEFAVKKFYDELHKDLHPIGAEFKLSTQYIDNAQPICGTTDILFYYDAPNPKDSGFVVGDWKGLDVNTPILTRDGWKTMGTIQIGDIVFDKNGECCKVLHTSEVHNRKCFKITFSNKDEIISDNEHRWLITFGDKKRGYNERVMTSEELFNYLNEFDSNIPSHKIPKIFNSKPIINEPIELPIDPYVLGCWLGDGNKADGKITNMDTWLWVEIKKRGYEIGKDVSQNGAGKAQTRTVLGLTTKLREMGLLHNKHIPEQFLLSSYEQRLDILRGLMDTDGYYNKVRNRFEMCTTQDWQVEATYTILSSLGIKPTVIKAKGKCNNCKIKKVFDKTIVAFTCDINPFLNKYKDVKLPTNNSYKYRYIVKVEDVESIPTRCIEVDSNTHTFLCGKNFLVTHNTNKELTKDFIRNKGIMMLPPFDNMYDEALSHYYVQFNLYQRMMESVGLKIIARRLIHIKSDGTYQIYTVPKLDDDIINQIIQK